MLRRWSYPVALVSMLAWPSTRLVAQQPTPADSESLAQQIADQFVLLAGGIHPGFRYNHAKGIVLTGTFTPTGEGASISRAAHFRGSAVPVIVRLSDASGIPNIPDTHPAAQPHGMAIRFTLPDKSSTDIVAVSHNGFIVGTGEDFLAFLKAVAATKPDSPHPSPVEAFLGTHPRAMQFVIDNAKLPTSFATLSYFSNNAVTFVDAKGKNRAVRYQIIPVAGVQTIESAAVATAGPDYLFTDLPQRLTRGPVQYTLYAQIASPGDPTNDGSIVWPADRQRVRLGTISLTAIAPNNAELQRSLAFSPVNLIDGIELSDDPLPLLRAAVYALSVAHRQ